MSTEEQNSKKELIRQKKLEHQSEAKVVRKIVFIIAIVLFLLIGGLTAGGYFYIQSALKPVDPGNETKKPVEIPIGSSVSGIAEILESSGVIKDARVFKYYVKLKNESGFMAGNYNMNPSMTIPEIIESLKTGRVLQDEVFRMTIPEGKQLSEIAGIIAEKTNSEQADVFNQLNDRAFIDGLRTKYPEVLTEEIFNANVKHPLEGYLFPATYPFYTEQPTLEEIVSVMLDKTNAVLAEYSEQMEEQAFTAHKLLTMASLIEEEATEQADRYQIASVFYNRIDTGMPLQTDPTVLYAHGEHKGRVLYEDLEIDSPYNTYQNQGLPPGPIANAGVMSIEAAINPKETNYLYFLATSKGDVLFSETLDEHNQKKAEHITNN
ncbi:MULTISPECIES: endolytic transglycosylase MltG [Bacillus]|uniref:endolytic transglycosylase MltG n=1 Tax=Bacillus TaxID=1386 RepID=UPI000C782C70|nr:MULTISPECIES: endolytic transglycosylase MltG [Bacillus]PLR81874.1 endolytic transglycosylase MltG [Bacillus sp. V33-4]RSK43901.1 endolytic transglycosylase MltG [Bacillus canaveralius]